MWQYQHETRVHYDLSRDDIRAWVHHHGVEKQSTWDWYLGVGLLGFLVVNAERLEWLFWLGLGITIRLLLPSWRSRHPAPELGARQLTLEAEGVRVESASACQLILWQAIHGMEETPTHFFLPYARSGVVIVRKDAFPDERAQIAFRAAVERRRCAALAVTG